MNTVTATAPGSSYEIHLSPPPGADAPNKETLDELISVASQQNSSALNVHRMNAAHGAKSITASINGHSDKSVDPPVVNYTAVVDDVYSQISEGDCLPPAIQEKRAELKRIEGYGGTEGAAAAEDLAYLDHTIISTAKAQEHNGVRPMTFNQDAQVDALRELATLSARIDAPPDSPVARQLTTLASMVSHLDTRSLSPDQASSIQDVVSDLAGKTQGGTLSPVDVTVAIADIRHIVNPDGPALSPEQQAEVTRLALVIAAEAEAASAAEAGTPEHHQSVKAGEIATFQLEGVLREASAAQARTKMTPEDQTRFDGLRAALNDAVINAPSDEEPSVEINRLAGEITQMIDNTRGFTDAQRKALDGLKADVAEEAAQPEPDLERIEHLTAQIEGIRLLGK